eukprot:230126-Amphidinium_carterae.1
MGLFRLQVEGRFGNRPCSASRTIRLQRIRLSFTFRGMGHVFLHVRVYKSFRHQTTSTWAKERHRNPRLDVSRLSQWLNGKVAARGLNFLSSTPKPNHFEIEAPQI